MRKILCSAVWYKDFELKKDDFPIGFNRPVNCQTGTVFCGLRHHNCMYQAIAITGKMQHELGEEVQGFLTTENEFVDRQEACTIAQLAGQVPLGSVRSGRLHSEDLWYVNPVKPKSK